MHKLHVLTRAAAALAAVEALLGSNPVQQQQRPASTTSSGTPKWVTTSSVEVKAPALQQRPLSSGIYLLIALLALPNRFFKRSHLCQIWLLSISHECYVSNLINFFSLNSFNLQFLEFFQTPDFLKFFANDPNAIYRIDIEHEMMMIRI